MKRLTTLLLVMTCSGALAGPAASPEEARKVTDAAMHDIAQGRVKAGFDRLKPHAVAEPGHIDMAATQSEGGLKAPAMIERYGSSLGFEFVREERAGSSLVRYLYLHKFENNALRWRFEWYRAGDRWRVVYFGFDDKLQELFTH